MKKKTAALCLALLLSLTMALTYSADLSGAYFTTFAVTKGGNTLSVDQSFINIREEFKALDKVIQVVNTGESDCVVRMKIFYPAILDTIIDEKNSTSLVRIDGENWVKEADGYYYYRDDAGDPIVLRPGESSAELVAAIGPWNELDEAFANSDLLFKDFNIIVVVENALVYYDADGTPLCDWNWKQGNGGE